MKKLISEVVGFEGLCTPVWLNTNIICNRIDGGITKILKNILVFILG